MKEVILAWSVSDFKTIVATVVATLIAGLIAWGFSGLLARKPKLIWYHDSKILEIELEGVRSRHLRFHKIVIENTGSSAAQNVALALPDTNAKIECKSSTRNWWSLDYLSSNIGKTNQVRLNQNQEVTLQFRRIEKNEIIELQYVGSLDSDLSPKGITFDGEFVQQVHAPLWFMTKNRLYWSVFRNNPLTPLIVGLLIGQIYHYAEKLFGLFK